MPIVRELVSTDQHWYPSPKKKDVWYPSVTTILDSWPKGIGFQMYLANQDSWDASRMTLKQAAERGTRVHEASENLELGGSLRRSDFSLSEWQMLMGFVAWHNAVKPKLLYVEHRVVSDKMRTGGTIDRVYEINGAVVLVDLKTSSKIYESHWVQVAAYSELLKLQDGIDVVRTGVLRLTDRKKEGYEYHEREKEDWQEDVKAFKAIQKVWDVVNPTITGPRYVEVPTELSLTK